jgi:hypothetical protein
MAGVMAIAAAVWLLPAPNAPPPPQPAGPAPTTAPQPPSSTAWFRPGYVPGGYRQAVDMEWPTERLGPPLPAARTFRKRHGDGQVTVSINPDLERLDVALEARTYPTVRVVPVRGRSGLLFPRRPGNFSTGLTWEERPGLVVQVVGGEGAPDRLLREVAEGLQISASPPAIAVGSLPPGWIPVPESELPVAAGNLLVLPRSHHQVFSKGDEGSQFVIIETRDQHDPAKGRDLAGSVPGARQEPVRVHGRPATLLSNPGNRGIPGIHELAVVWREPGGIELVVLADDAIGRRRLLAIAQGLRQP